MECKADILILIDPTDGEIVKQMDGVIDSINSETEIFTDKFPIKQLHSEFAHDSGFVPLIDQIVKLYSSYRKSRPDGNCYIRSFIYSYLECAFTNYQEKKDDTLIRNLKEIVSHTKGQLVRMGIKDFIFSDFLTDFEDIISRLTSENSFDIITMKYEEYDTSVVYFMRLILSSYLNENAKEYEERVAMIFMTVDDYRKKVIEVMNKESDELVILLLPTIFNVKIRIEYLDQSKDKTLHHYDVPDNDDGKEQIFSLLYRPSHYDPLYK